jgi:outer membrane protein assembly factor BamB
MKQNILNIFLLFFSFSVFAQSGTISQWRGPNRDGIYNETELLKSWPENGPPLIWHFDQIGDGHSSAAITKDRIYTAGTISGTGYIFSFSLDGQLLWKVPYGEEWSESWPGTRSTPLIYDGKIYLLSGMGKLACMKADKGEMVWALDVIKDLHGRNIKWGYTENLLVDGNKIFCTVGGIDTNIVALDRNTGKLIWVSKGNGEKSAYCSPALITLPNRKILVTQTENSILGIDAANGKVLWRHDQPNLYSVHANTPLYHDGFLYCVSGYGKGGVLLKIAYDGSAKQEVWRNDSLDTRMGGVVLLNDRIYGSDDRNRGWRCIDWKTGKEIYSEKITNKGNIISADGMLYCYGDNGEVVLAETTAAGFRKISSFKVPFGSNQHWAHLVIAGGRLYVRHGNSLMVYDIKKK